VSLLARGLWKKRPVAAPDASAHPSDGSTTATNGNVIQILVAGEVAEESITRLGAGGADTSKIIATDINQGATADQCRLIRIDRPDGSEFVVGTCDENDNLAIQPRASQDKSTLHVYNVRAYGAVPNWDGTTAGNDGTANLGEFIAALAAMKADSNRNTKLVADGWFYLSDALHINQSIVFEGMGRSEPEGGGGARSWPGTWLVFPVNKNGIVLHSGFDEEGGADFTVLRNLTVSCDGSARPIDQTGHGIWIHCWRGRRPCSPATPGKRATSSGTALLRRALPSGGSARRRAPTAR
jgi:hypothetical protein